MTMTRMYLPAVILVFWASPVFAQKTYSDPAPYCKVVGTIDKPGRAIHRSETSCVDGKATEYAA